MSSFPGWWEKTRRCSSPSSQTVQLIRGTDGLRAPGPSELKIRVRRTTFLVVTRFGVVQTFSTKSIFPEIKSATKTTNSSFSLCGLTYERPVQSGVWLRRWRWTPPGRPQLKMWLVEATASSPVVRVGSLYPAWQQIIAVMWLVQRFNTEIHVCKQTDNLELFIKIIYGHNK